MTAPPSPYDNYWLLEALRDDKKSGNFITILFAARSCHSEVLQSLISFPGKKVFIPLVDPQSLFERTPTMSWRDFSRYRKNTARYENIIKNAMCFADLVILAPSPLWSSCDMRLLSCYPEFNVNASSVPLEGGLRAWGHMYMMKQLIRIFNSNLDAVRHGMVTYLPLLGYSPHRWWHPDLGLPDLEKCYKLPGEITDYHIHMYSLLSLIVERMMAEKLSAAHLNVNSYDRPALNDLVFDVYDLPSEQNKLLQRAVFKIDVPGLDQLDLKDIVRLRRDYPDAFRSFSDTVLARLNPGSYDADQIQSEIDKLSNEIRAETRNLESKIQGWRSRISFTEKKILAKSAGFAVGTTIGGTVGATMGWLLGGGLTWDLFDLKSHYRQRSNEMISLREDSFFIAMKMLETARHKEKYRTTLY